MLDFYNDLDIWNEKTIDTGISSSIALIEAHLK